MPKKQMLCLDFDQTLVKAHYHGECIAAGFTPMPYTGVIVVNEQTGIQDSEPSHAFLANLLHDENTGPKNGKAIVDIIVKAIQRGDKISVVSYSLFPKAIINTLAHMFDKYSPLNKQLVDQICVVTGYPSQMNNGKEEHIQAAIEYFEKQHIAINRNDCLLVDDDVNNIKVAHDKHHPFTVTVPTSGDNSLHYLDEINTKLARGRAVNASDIEKAKERLENVLYRDYYFENRYKPYYEDNGELSETFDEIYDAFIESLAPGQGFDAMIKQLCNLGEDFSVEQVHAIVKDTMDDPCDVTDPTPVGNTQQLMQEMINDVQDKKRKETENPTDEKTPSPGNSNKRLKKE